MESNKSTEEIDELSLDILKIQTLLSESDSDSDQFSEVEELSTLSNSNFNPELLIHSGENELSNSRQSCDLPNSGKYLQHEQQSSSFDKVSQNSANNREPEKSYNSLRDVLSSELESYTVDFDTCLALNRVYQETIKEQLQRLDEALVKVREQQINVKRMLDESGKRKSKMKSASNKHLIFSLMPFFKDSNGCVPEPNIDVKLKRVSGEPDLNVRTNTFSACSWKLKKLFKSVVEFYLEKKKNIFLNRVVKLNSELKKVSDPDEKERLTDKMDQVNLSIDKLADLPPEQLVDGVEDAANVDWMKISIKHFDGEFTPECCRQAWTNAIHPSINCSKWSESEDSKLIEICQENEFTGWTKISLNLKTNRTAFQCLQRYQTKLNPSLQTGSWHAEEDEKLKMIVEQCTEFDKVSWNQVAFLMENRSGEQCLERWNKLQCGALKLGPFSSEEDDIILKAYEKYGPNWVHIGQIMKTRNGQQIRDRYYNNLADGVKKSDWTEDEDRKLLYYYNLYGNNAWTKIASQLPGRTDSQIPGRYKMLVRWQSIAELLVTLPIEDVIRASHRFEYFSGRPQAKDTLIKLNEIKRQIIDREYRQRCFINSETYLPDLVFMADKNNSSELKNTKEDLIVEQKKRYNIDKPFESANEVEKKITEVNALIKKYNDRRSATDEMLRSELVKVRQQFADGTYFPRSIIPTHINIKKFVETLRKVKDIKSQKPPADETSIKLSTACTLRDLENKMHQKATRSLLNLFRKARQENVLKSRKNAQKNPSILLVEQEISRTIRERFSRRQVGRPRKNITISKNDYTRDEKDLQQRKREIIKFLIQKLSIDVDQAAMQTFHYQKQFNIEIHEDKEETDQESEDEINLNNSPRSRRKRNSALAQTDRNKKKTKKSSQNCSKKKIEKSYVDGLSRVRLIDSMKTLRQGIENEKWVSIKNQYDPSLFDKTTYQKDCLSPSTGYTSSHTTQQNSGQDSNLANTSKQKSSLKSKHHNKPFISSDDNNCDPTETDHSPSNSFSDTLTGISSENLNNSTTKSVSEPILNPLPPSIATVNALHRLLLKRRMLKNPNNKLPPKLPITATSLCSLLKKTMSTVGKEALTKLPPASSIDVKIPTPEISNLMKRIATDAVRSKSSSTLQTKLTLSQMRDVYVYLSGNKGRYQFDKLTASMMYMRMHQLNQQRLVTERETRSYQLLKARFRSIFTWPALLSATPVSQTSSQLLHPSEPIGKKTKPDNTKTLLKMNLQPPTKKIKISLRDSN